MSHGLAVQSKFHATPRRFIGWHGCCNPMAAKGNSEKLT
jgi:hypothetical protein